MIGQVPKTRKRRDEMSKEKFAVSGSSLVEYSNKLVAGTAEGATKYSKSGPDRFWLAKGKGSRIIILDSDVLGDDIKSVWEHSIKVDNSWGNFEVCTDPNEPCPLCEEAERAQEKSRKPRRNENVLVARRSFITFFTVLSEWEDKDGKTRFTKKLMAWKHGTSNSGIKSSISEMVSLLAKHKQKYGTDRGCILYMKREDTDKSKAIGEPVEYPGVGKNGKGSWDKRWSHISEEKLAEKFGQDFEIEGKKVDGSVRITPYDYEKTFIHNDRTADEINKAYSLSESLFGSKKAKEEDEDLDSIDDELEDEVIETEDEIESEVEEVEDEFVEEDEADDELEEVPDDDDFEIEDDLEEEVKPKAKPKPKVEAKPKTTKTRKPRPKVQEEVEDVPEDEDEDIFDDL